jgi:hypothetical protein
MIFRGRLKKLGEKHAPVALDLSLISCAVERVKYGHSPLGL